MILIVSLIPIILFGTKYVLDQRTSHEVQLNDGKAVDFDKLVKNIALTLAENWNPGLTLGQQRAAIHKVADEEYNKVASNSLITLAVPRLDIGHYKKSSNQGRTFEPLKMEIDNLSISRICYESKTKYLNRYGFTNSDWNPNFAMWRIIDEKTDPGHRISEFDEIYVKDGKYVLDYQDIFSIPMIKRRNSQFIVTTQNKANDYATYLRSTSYTGTASLIKSAQENYQSRDLSAYMNISVTSDDKIKVSLNGKEGFASPAKCNVDIVLAIPVNGAASNRYNRDAASNSDTDYNPQSEESTDNQTLPTAIKETPIYQMGQACKEFVKKFYNTHGVYMSLIPYSAKVSIAPDKTLYARVIDRFSESYFLSHPLTNRKICGAALYGTSGDKSKALATTYSWGNQKTGYPIMCRRGEVWTPNDYGQNKLAKGNLTSTANPNTDALKYQRMNLNPCYLGYANMLSMKCDKTCKTYQPNPYYMIEPTADMVKIYEMCNALYPIYDFDNISNFVFIPIEWTRNFFQTWTNPISASATTGSSDSATLSKPEKTTSRKKALILLVNKPDWFEPGELTYVGFDNDYSDIPTYESDRINFSINYGNHTTKKFLYNESYDGTIAGPKKVLQYMTRSGSLSKGTYYHATGTATGRLTFPRKGVVMIRVDRYNNGSTATFKFTNANDSTSFAITKARTFRITPANISDTKDDNGNYYVEFTMTNINLIFAEISNRDYVSISPSCSLSGTTCATGSTQQTTYINTNVLEPIQIKAKPTSASGTVKFTNISSYTMDGTSYSSGTNHTLTTPKTFTFPGGSLSSSSYSRSNNFGSNYGINKIGYTINNASITDANIAAGSQILRYDSSGKDPGLAIYNANTGTNELSSYTSSYYKYWTIVTMGINNVFAKWTTNYSQDSYTYSCTKYKDVWTTNGCTENYSCTKYKDVWTTNGCTESYNCTKYKDVWTTNGCSESYSCTKYGDVWTTNGCSESYDCTKYESYSCQEPYDCCKKHKYTVTYKNFEFTSSGWKYQHSNNKTTTHERDREIYPVTADNYCSTFTPGAYNCTCNGNTVSPCYRCAGCTTSSNNLSSIVLGVSYEGCSQEGTCYRSSTCTRSYTGTCTRKYDCYVYKSYTGTCHRYYDCYVNKSYTDTCYRNYDCYVSTPYSSTCTRNYDCYINTPYTDSCTGYQGSAGNMGYSALNTANIRSGTDIYSQSVPWRSTSTPSAYSSWTASSSYGTYSGAGGKSAVFYIVNSTGAVGQQLTAFYAKNNGQAITWGGMNQSDTWVNNNQGISANSSYIRFNGDSTVTVTVTPNVIDGYIYYTTPAQVSSSHTISGSDWKTIIIDPTTHYYEKTSSGYRIVLNLKEVELDTSYGAQFVTTPSTDYRYKTIDKSGTNVRYINYTTSGNPSYDSSLFYTSNSTYYNGVNCAIAANSSHNNVSYISPRTLWGDIINIMEENSPSEYMPPYVHAIIGENGSNIYYVPGTTRIFAPITRGSTYKYLTLTEKSGSDSTTSGGALNLLTTNITYPANYVLCQGEYQRSNSNTPTAAAANVTADLCSKLKSDQGSNLRIYVLKYRKQEKYKTFPTYADGSSVQSHDYSAVDGCATSTNYVFNISNEGDLKSVLNAIAVDIKSWAKYQAAK